jgi:hypothetical protein
MPNPVRLIALDNSKAHFKKNATQRQRISLTKVGETAPRHIVELPEPAIPLEVGEWLVLHETFYGGRWVRGLGRNDGAYQAEFDDNPQGAGDNDYNDAVVTFIAST